MTEQERPRTEAGRALLEELSFRENYLRPGTQAAAIVAIEEAARTEGRQQAVREARDLFYAEDRLWAQKYADPILDRVAGLNASESPPTVDEVVYEEGGEQVVIRRRVGDASESPQPPEASDV